MRGAVARSGLSFLTARAIEQTMNTSTAENAVKWLFLDLNTFFASCEQQENPALRNQPVIVVQTMTDSAVAIYAAKAFGIKTGTLMREARQLCPGVVPVQANHRLYTEYHERILKAVDNCLPIEKVCSIDEMACRLMGTERQVPVARELALRVKGAPCASRSANASPARSASRPMCFSASSRPTCKSRTAWSSSPKPKVLLDLELQEIYGIGARMEQRVAPRRHRHRRPALERDAVSIAPGVGWHQRRAVRPDAARRRHPAPLLPPFQKFSGSLLTYI
jgi:DNA polymerase IV